MGGQGLKETDCPSLRSQHLPAVPTWGVGYGEISVVYIDISTVGVIV